MNANKFTNPGVNYTQLGNYQFNNPCAQGSYYEGQIGSLCNNFRNTQGQNRNMPYGPMPPLPPYMNCNTKQENCANKETLVETYMNSRNPNYLAKLGGYQIDNPCNQDSYYARQIGDDCNRFVKANLEARDLNGNPVAPADPFMNCSGGNCAGTNPSRSKAGFGMGIF
jgi:hypothetical protein